MNGVTYLAERPRRRRRWRSSRSRASTARTARPAPRSPPRPSGSRSSTTARAPSCPGSDQTPVITELVNAQPDIVWATINPTTLAEIMGGAVRPGPAGAVVGQLADLQLPAARHRPRAGARRAVHALDVHPALELRRLAGHDRDGRGHARASGPTRRSPTSTSWPGPRATSPSRSSRRRPPTAT